MSGAKRGRERKCFRDGERVRTAATRQINEKAAHRVEESLFPDFAILGVRLLLKDAHNGAQEEGK